MLRNHSHMPSPSAPSEERSEGNPLFVNDFVAVDVSVETAIQSFGGVATPALLRDVVLEAWRAEVAALDSALATFTAHDEPSVEVELGPARWRRDAVVIPVRWWTLSGDWVPPLEADLELASFGPERTHLHVLGRSRLPLGESPHSQASSLHHRFTVAMVRHVLSLLSERVLATDQTRNLSG